MKFFSLNQLPLCTDDYSLTFFNDLSKKDAIVIFNPANALIASPVFLRSSKSLDEQIDYIRKNNIKKAKIIAEDIGFLRQCPNLECLEIYPAVTADDFNYSPIYELPNIKLLQCQTEYGYDEEKNCTIDYSHFPKAECLRVFGKGHLNVRMAENVEKLDCGYGFPDSISLAGHIPEKRLVKLSVMLSPIRSLNGIESASQIKTIDLSNNRRLEDISALRSVSKSLKHLKIDQCGKIKDFSVLKELHGLEFLVLRGSNSLENLSFLKELHHLKYFHITMNVKDGDIRWCENIPYVRIKNRKHYSHKDSDLPKNYPDYIVDFPFDKY